MVQNRERVVLVGNETNKCVRFASVLIMFRT